MKRIFLFVTLLSGLTSFAHAPNWGKTGHRATAEIAETYLTDKAKAAVSDLLDGDGMALVATYPDDIKSDKAYNHYSIWHYINIPEGKEYEDIQNDKDENIIWAIQKVKRELKDPKVSKEKKQFYLKFLIHLIGDLHQPMHVGRPDDLGGNKIIVFWFGEASNLHKVWDDDMLDSYKMSYSELAANQKKLSDKEIKEIQKGTEIDWLKESYNITKKIYDTTENGYHLSYNYMYDWIPTVREQLQKGGIRLAKELNEIFG